jgi:hypothetical protein
MEIKTFLISNGWKYLGQTCGCGGSAKLDKYSKGNQRLSINLRKETYKINVQKPISEIQTDPEII